MKQTLALCFKVSSDPTLHHITHITRVVRWGRADLLATNAKFTTGLTAAEVEQLHSTVRAMLDNADQAILEF